MGPGPQDARMPVIGKPAVLQGPGTPSSGEQQRALSLKTAGKESLRCGALAYRRDVQTNNES